MSADEDEETGAAVEQDSHECEYCCDEEIDKESGEKNSSYKDMLAKR